MDAASHASVVRSVDGPTKEARTKEDAVHGKLLIRSCELPATGLGRLPRALGHMCVRLLSPAQSGGRSLHDHEASHHRGPHPPVVEA